MEEEYIVGRRKLECLYFMAVVVEVEKRACDFIFGNVLDVVGIMVY